MPWRSRLIASVRSSRSVTRLACCASTSFSSSSARRLTAPSRSRSRRSLSSRSSTAATSGSASPGAISASAATCAGSVSSISRISCAMSAGAPLRGLEPLLGARLARCARRPSPRARHAPPCRPRRARSRRRRAGRRLRAARPRRCSTSCDQRAALLGEGGRRAFERGALGLRVALPLLQRGDLAGRAALRRPFHSARFGRDRGEALRAQLGLARERLRFAARFGQHRALGGDLAARFRQLVFQLRRRAERLDRLRGVVLGGERLVAARREADSLPRRAPRGARSAGSPRARPPHARRAPHRLAPAPRAAHCALRPRPRPPRRARLRRLRRCGAWLRHPWRAWASSASRSASRFFAASRRAAAVGAFEAAAKPSQRHRSPSGETSRWPGSQLPDQRRARARGRPRRSARAGAASSGGAVTWRASGSAPSGSAGSAASAAAPAQRIGEAGSTGASRSSPSAAPSAASKPFSTVSRSIAGGHSFFASTSISLASAFASASSRPTRRSASASGPRATSSPWRAAECAASVRSAAASAAVTALCAASAAPASADDIRRAVLGLVQAGKLGLDLADLPLEPHQPRRMVGHRAFELVAPRHEVGERAGQFAERLLDLGERRLGRASRAPRPRPRVPPRRPSPASGRLPRWRAAPAPLRRRRAAAARARYPGRTAPGGGRARRCAR